MISAVILGGNLEETTSVMFDADTIMGLVAVVTLFMEYLEPFLWFHDIVVELKFESPSLSSLSELVRSEY